MSIILNSLLPALMALENWICEQEQECRGENLELKALLSLGLGKAT